MSAPQTGGAEDGVLPPPVRSAPGRTRRWWLWLVAILVVLTLGVMAVVVLVSDSAEPTDAANSSQGTAEGSGPDGVDNMTTKDEDKGPLHVVGPNATVTPALSGREAEGWALLLRVLGTERVVAKIATVKVFDSPNDDTEASVSRTDDDPARFDMEINIARLSDTPEQVTTYIHEFAHTLSLSGDQVSDVQGACPRLEVSVGCVAEGSYIEEWNNAFWKAYGKSIPPASEDDRDAVRAFYEKHPGDFVTEYAATTVLEDFSETFAVWVMDASGTAAKSPLIKKKFAVLESHDEFRALRSDIRKSMDPAWLR